ncbi:21946_t:CDS:1, partial [Gigaspora rosea]
SEIKKFNCSAVYGSLSGVMSISVKLVILFISWFMVLTGPLLLDVRI